MINLIAIAAILAAASIAVLVFGFSASMIGYGLLKSTAKFGSSSASAPSSPPVVSTGWTLQYSPNMPTQMSKASDGSYFVDLPSKDGLHYVVEKTPKLQLGQLVSMNFSISGSGTVIPVQGTKAQVSLYMQRQGDNMSGAGAMQQYRYWHSAVPMVSGDGSISATLTPDQWTDVKGQPGTSYPNQFAECVANAGVIGFTCGDPSAGAAGHGVYVKDGAARFTLKSFTIA